MADTDRRAILARRALFIASALGSVSGVARAQSIQRASDGSAAPEYELPALECPESDPDAHEALLASAFERIQRAKQTGDLKAALEAAQSAFEYSPHPLFLFEQAKLERELLRYDLALQHLRALTSCDFDSLQEFREEIDAAIEFLRKQPVIVVQSDESVAAQLGADSGRGAGPKQEWIFRVPPGEHEVTVDRAGDVQTFTVQAKEGEVVTIEVHFAAPTPYLSPAICLEPPPPPPPVDEGSWRPRLELGVLPLVPVGRNAIREMAPIGVGARLGVDYGLSEGSSVSFGLASWVLDGVGGVLVPLGGYFDFNLHLGSAWIGLGATSGYELGAEGRIPEANTPSNGFFLSPELTFFGFQVSERLSLASRVQVLLGARGGEPGSDFGVTHVGAGVWVGYRFGASDRDEYYAGSPSLVTF